MAVQTIKTQRRKESNLPYPPKFKSLDDVQDYLKRLYTALSEKRDLSYAGNIFMSLDQPEDMLGKDGDIFIQISE